MSWGEAIRLLGLLRKDATSQFAAALAGWRYPADLSTLVMLDLFDFQATMRWVDGGKKGPKPKPHPARPWTIDDRDRRRVGNTKGMTRDEVLAILRDHGHQIPV